ncbi:MAG: type VI secretion protein IcmF/TssM N-terminal domain-containing protein [Alphaproteobacteria bacterium]
MEFLSLLRDVLGRLAPYLPFMIGSIVFLALAVMSLIFLIIHRRRKQSQLALEDRSEPSLSERDDDDYEAFDVDPDDLPNMPLRRSFRHAVKLLRDHVNVRDYRYSIPWYLLIGPEGSGKSTLAENIGLNLPLGRPAEDWEGIHPGCKWWFFDRGVILDIAGDFVRRRDGRGSDTNGWSLLLRLLEQWRPRRPIDGIVVAIPVDDLLTRTGAPRPPEDLKRRAEALYKKLWQAQVRLGLAFPVYIMLTKGDSLTGFQPFVRELPLHAHRDILGWSSPYNFDSQFNGKWVDEAVSSISQSVLDAQLEIFATQADLPDAEDLFQFPAAIDSLNQPLQIYLQQIFKPSAYHEAFALRGVFLTGDDGEGRDQFTSVAVMHGVYSGPKDSNASPVFLTDVFANKIFPEKGLARPARRALLSRNRHVLAAQAASAALIVFGGIWLAWASAGLGSATATVRPFIEKVASKLERLDQTRAATGQSATEGIFDHESALILLEGMTQLNTDSLILWSVPTSWFSELDDDVVRFTTKAFNRVILQSMRAGLVERGRELSAGRMGDTDALDIGPEAVARGDEFSNLSRYTLSVRRFEEAVDRFNRLNDSEEIEDVKQLVQYLFGTTLPDEFTRHARFYEEALASAVYRQIEVEPIHHAIGREYLEVEKAAIDGMFIGSPLVRNLESLARLLDAAAVRRSQSIEVLQEIRTLIRNINEGFRDPRYSWIDNPDFNVDTAFETTIGRIAGSGLLGPEVAEAFVSKVRRSWVETRAQLGRITSFTVGPLIVSEDGNPKPRFTNRIENLYIAIEALFAKPFMQVERSQSLPAPPAGLSSVEWNIGLLQETLSLIGEYDTYVKDEINVAPRPLHALIAEAAAQRLEQNANTRIAQAHQVSRSLRGGVRAENSLQREVANFSQAAPMLAAVLGAYDELALADSYLGLADLFGRQGIDILDTVDVLFTEERFYLPVSSGLSNWNGERGAALAAFLARDELGLRDILSNQRDRLMLIAGQYAKPVVNSLQSLQNTLFTESERVLLEKWSDITEETEKLRLKKPDSTISQLEDFILGPMMSASLSTCKDVVGEETYAIGVSDFFRNRQAQLRRQLAQRCRELAGAQAIDAYSAIVDQFADRLQGRFPFSAGAYRPDQREVSPRDLREFFLVYDSNVDQARAALETAGGFGLSREFALRFLNEMDDVRTFFDSFLQTGSTDDTPFFDLAVSFRVNRQAEIGANQVIDWAMQVGNRQVTIRDAEKSLRWTLGDRVRLSFRWAENGTLVPASSGGGGNVSVVDRTVTETFDNAWSLVDLIRRHAAGSDSFADFADPQPHTLRFDIPTRPAAGGPVQQSRLFSRIELSGSVDGQPIFLTMPTFPAAAPLLGQ